MGLPLSSESRPLTALLLLVPAPTLGVLASMWWFAGTAGGQAAYVLSKLWILAIPLVWQLWIDRRPLGLSPARHGGLGTGVAVGIATLAVILGSFAVVGERLIDPELIRARARETGLDVPARYLTLSAYLILVNSLLEEYVWRWFVFVKCSALLGRGPAVAASAFFFMLHHVVALKAQFGWPVTILGSAGTLIGGLLWSACYLRYRSIWPGYVAHVLADVGVLIAGWLLIF